VRSAVVLASITAVVAPEVRVHVIDPPGGDDPDGRRVSNPEALERRRAELRAQEFGDRVDLRAGEAHDAEWREDLALLLVDGRHDFASVLADLSHFEPHLAPGVLVAFHDYGSHAPGVMRVVDHLVRTGAYEAVDRAESLMVLRKRSGALGLSIGAILEQMDSVEGWLERDEAALLALLAASVAASPEPADLVEVGSLCGRATVVLGGVVRGLGSHQRVVAVDLFDGVVGAADTGLIEVGPTRDRFREAIRTAGLENMVEVVETRRTEAPWGRPVGLLVIDGLHDLASVRADYAAFEASLLPGALVAFHDYAEYFPGVRAFVGELLLSGDFEEVAREGTLIALRRVAVGARTVRTALRPTVVLDSPRVSESPEIEVGPLASCLMPTFNRRQWIPAAIERFLAQDYPHRELVVIDDGSDPVGDLMPDDPRVRYLLLSERQSIGAKRNLGAEAARGELLAHWDDDDWYADSWLRRAVGTLIAEDTEIVGLDTVLFFDPALGKAWRYQYPADARPWVHDPTFCYRRALWSARPFPDTNYGLDTTYLWGSATQRLARVPDHRLFVGTIHPGNTSIKQTADTWWHPHPAEDIVALKGGQGSLPPIGRPDRQLQVTAIRADH
jgi:hypothetical protein